MKYLVRDGAKKLRDASALPDDVLLSVNRSRSTSFLSSGVVSPTSRKRVSPSAQSEPPFSPLHTSSRITPHPQSAPPKLKGHPRDHRRDDNRRRGFLPTESCFGPQYGDTSDFLSHGFNSIWNCGHANEDGTSSPIQMVVRDKEFHHGMSQARQQPILFEGRNESSYSGRQDPANVSMRA